MDSDNLTDPAEAPWIDETDPHFADVNNLDEERIDRLPTFNIVAELESELGYPLAKH